MGGGFLATGPLGSRFSTIFPNPANEYPYVLGAKIMNRRPGGELPTSRPRTADRAVARSISQVHHLIDPP